MSLFDAFDLNARAFFKALDCKDYEEASRRYYDKADDDGKRRIRQHIGKTWNVGRMLCCVDPMINNKTSDVLSLLKILIGSFAEYGKSSEDKEELVNIFYERFTEEIFWDDKPCYARFIVFAVMQFELYLYRHKEYLKEAFAYLCELGEGACLQCVADNSDRLEQYRDFFSEFIESYANYIGCPNAQEEYRIFTVAFSAYSIVKLVDVYRLENVFDKIVSGSSERLAKLYVKYLDRTSKPPAWNRFSKRSVNTCPWFAERVFELDLTFADSHFFGRDDEFVPVLQEAIRRNQKQVYDYLVKRHCLDPFTETRSGYTPLMMAAYLSDFELLKKLWQIDRRRFGLMMKHHCLIDGVQKNVYDIAKASRSQSFINKLNDLLADSRPLLGVSPHYPRKPQPSVGGKHRSLKCDLNNPGSPACEFVNGRYCGNFWKDIRKPTSFLYRKLVSMGYNPAELL